MKPDLPVNLLVLGLSIGSSLVLLFGFAFQWTLMDALTPFLAPLLLLVLLLAFGLCGVVAFVHLCLRARSRGARAALPLLMQAAALALVVYVPWTAVALEADFRWKYDARMELIHKIETREISEDFITGRPDLSKSGDIYVTRHDDGKTVTVFFFTYRGILDSFAGYLYCSDPAATPQAPAGQYRQWKEVQPHWYWVTAH